MKQKTKGNNATRNQKTAAAKSTTATANGNKGTTTAGANTAAAKALDKANLAAGGRGAMVDPAHDGRHTNNTGRAGKYIYPDDVKTVEERKAYRRRARAALRKFDSAIKDLSAKRNDEDVKRRKELEKDMQQFVKSTYTPGVPLVTDVAGDVEKK
jgi:hypothetical protein